jgi:hypothetical protein
MMSYIILKFQVKLFRRQIGHYRNTNFNIFGMFAIGKYHFVAVITYTKAINL